MGTTKWQERCDEYRSRLQCLVTAKSLTVSDILAERNAHTVPGVYCISQPEDTEIVYVGRTKTKGISGRIADHKRIDTASDLRVMLKRNPQFPQEIDDYRIRYARINDDRDRLFFEMFAIGCLAPMLNK